MAEREMAGLDNILFRRTDNNRAAQKSISSDSCCAMLQDESGSWAPHSWPWPAATREYDIARCRCVFRLFQRGSRAGISLIWS